MVWHCLKIIWWVLLAIAPLLVVRIARQILSAIGCPPGDCYLPGAGAASDLASAAFVFLVLTWPVCLWHIAGLSRQLVRTIKDKPYVSAS
jgi:hypothetical protein